MRNKCDVKILLAFFLCLAAFGYAQILPFENYSIKDGLPSNWITSIFQDSRGYLWVGGDGGFAIYDGINFKTYDVDAGLPVGFVWCFAESRKSPGTIYIGTNGGGLAKFENGKITSRLLNSRLPPVEISLHNAVHAIFEDQDGVIWCATNRGLYHVRDDSASFFFAGSDSSFVEFIVPTRDGRLWFNAGKELYNYSPAARTVERAELNIHSAPLACMFEDEDRTVWLGAANGFIYKLRDQRVVASQSIGAFEISGIVDDEEGNIWVAAGGLLKIAKADFAKNEFTRYTTENGLPDNVLSSCFVDREHNLWLSSRRSGLLKLSEHHLTRFAFTGLNSRPDILNHTAVADTNGHLFVATEKGLWEMWKNRNGTWTKFLHELPELAARPEKKAFAHHTSVAISQNGLLWHPLHGGGLAGYKITRQPQQPSRLTLVKKLIADRDLPEGNPIGITIDRDNRLWYVIWQHGIVQLDLSTLKIRADLALNTPQDFLQDDAGRIWLGTFNEGIYVFEFENGAHRLRQRLGVNDSLASDRIRALLQRRNGEIWIGYRYDGISIYKNGKFETLTTKDGLLHNAVWALAEDTDGRVWIGTSAGVQQAAPDNYRKLFADSHWIGSFTEGVGVIAGEKTMWALSADELILYEYGRATRKSPPPPIYLTGVRVNGKESRLAGQSGLKFSYDENLCTMLFTGISFKGENSLRYKYRLLGLNDDWQEPTDQRAVTYASLQPGDYTFEVTAMNADGVESVAPAAFPFTISPPFWQRWWFMAFCAVILGSVLYAIHVVRLNRLLEIEKIRARIATDLHDDIGAGLTHIGLLSQVALQRSGAPQNREHEASSPAAEQAPSPPRELNQAMERVGNIARELSAAMSDVVWSVNPQHDSMAALQRRLRTFAHEICEAKGIALQFEVAERMTSVKLHPEIRRNLLLIAKEALHNAVKYSGSSSVSVKFLLNHKNILMEVVDAGKGFEVAQAKNGNGLANMRTRAEKLGGRFEIVSELGKGTRIQLIAPIKA
ncbi:MAG: sensor histidine kinase [bacterium]